MKNSKNIPVNTNILKEIICLVIHLTVNHLGRSLE